MPFIRYTRDKRGYESAFVMHAYRGNNGASRTRVLYLFRSPSNLKVGRRALDPEVREALEHTHPDLSFDWETLTREPAAARPDPRERPVRSGRSEAQRRAPEPPPPVIEDESLLGRTLGGAAAARLRRRYAELLQRILRRARTPEERDRLTERLQRLNPDEWPDEAAVHAAAATVDADWDALVAELPQRRRGRRGGRREDGPPAGSAAGESSGIITEEGNPHDIDEVDAGPLEPGGDAPGPGDGGRVSPDAAEGAAAGADDRDLPRGDGHHLD